jgi:glycosyltransferase involved in cell wall biosynthesis
MSKKILLIGMLNSVHTANWLERIQFLNLEIHLFPSRQYKKLHPKIEEIVKNNSNVTLNKLIHPQFLSVYLEFLLDTRWLNWASLFSRKSRLEAMIRKNSYLRIHALEIQHAGYLLTESLPQDLELNNLMITNWGSDIYYFGQFPEHEMLIRKCLAVANYYSAECQRDYQLARDFGFSGIELPVVPNSTTFAPEFFSIPQTPTEARTQIIMKCYGSTFGYGKYLLQIAEKLVKIRPDLNIFAYSVTPDLEDYAYKICATHPENFRFSTVGHPKTHTQMLNEFSRSRIYVGASRSDGISTSFLEAIATGAYPVQTSTSCANEWVSRGAIASIVPPVLEDIEKAIIQVIDNFEHLQNAQNANIAIARRELSFSYVSEVTKSFYTN